MSNPEAQQGKVTDIQRVRHPYRIIAFGVVVILLLAGAFVAGQFVRSPNDEALNNAERQVSVFAAVEERVVGAGFALAAKLVPAPEVDILVLEVSTEASSSPPAKEPSTPNAGQPSTSENTDTKAEQPSTSEKTKAEQPSTAENADTKAERVVVSSTAVKKGDSLASGQLIAEIAGRPLFAWPANVPLFRNLSSGDKGNDVRGVQETLTSLGYYNGTVDGVYGAGTESALRALYRAADYALPYVEDGVQGLAWREFVATPASTTTVVSIASVGTELSAEVPLLRVQNSVATLSVLATTLEIDELTVGATVGIVVTGGTPVQGTVTSAGEFTTDEESSSSGYPVSISLPPGVVIGPSDTVQIRPWAQSDPALAVPAVAIRQDKDGTFVLVRGDGESSNEPNMTRVAVTALAQGDGWVSVAQDSGLTVGTEVLVSNG